MQTVTFGEIISVLFLILTNFQVLAVQSWPGHCLGVTNHVVNSYDHLYSMDDKSKDTFVCGTANAIYVSVSPEFNHTEWLKPKMIQFI